MEKSSYYTRNSLKWYTVHQFKQKKKLKTSFQKNSSKKNKPLVRNNIKFNSFSKGRENTINQESQKLKNTLIKTIPKAQNH